MMYYHEGENAQARQMAYAIRRKSRVISRRGISERIASALLIVVRGMWTVIRGTPRATQK